MSTNPDPGGDLTEEGQRLRLDEGVSTRLTRGVVEGFTDASEAFSHELAGTSRIAELMGRSVAGVIRANARLHDGLATLVRQMTDDFAAPPRTPPRDQMDYERLAELVATRLGPMVPTRATVRPTEAAGRAGEG